MNSVTFVEAVQRIAASQPTYRTGGDGSDGNCDCIGLIMGALGRKYDLHSSNYFARCQMKTLDNLLDESQLHAGAVVYKSRRDTSQLNARYQAGGRYYNGDLLDYYHVGVVTRVDPLVITHCTSSENINGIAHDSSIGKWSHVGDLLDVELTDTAEENKMATIMRVIAQTGETVNVRQRPDSESPRVGKVNVGQTVSVFEKADGWAKIESGSLRGYMMTEFLQEEKQAGKQYTIVLDAEVAAALAAALASADII